MFFQEHEKRIYQPPGSEKKYDPIRVDRILVASTGGRFDELIAWRNAPHDNLGDVSPKGKETAKLRSAQAELELAQAARHAFELPAFPECTDGQALEILYNFLGWMEGKGETAGKPQSSLITSPDAALYFGPTKTTSDSLSTQKPSES